MRPRRTISVVQMPHNGHVVPSGNGAGFGCGIIRLLLLAGAASSAIGCATARPLATEVTVWELVDAEPVRPRLVARTRLGWDQPLPDHLVQHLCDEFTVMMITRQPDWSELRRSLELYETPKYFDFTSGAVIGILADVGEATNQRWPVEIETIRTRSGEGWIDARFSGGVFYPLRCPGYLELVYAPELHAIRLVRINNRTFLLRSTPHDG